MKIIDLTHQVSQDLSHSPFDEALVMKTVKTVKEDGYGDTLLKTTMHLGTHIDAPSHMLENGKMISDFSLEHFIGEGVLIDVQNSLVIEVTDAMKERIKPESMVLFYSGMAHYFNDEAYYEHHPVLSDELVAFLIQQKVKCILLDFYSPDKSPFELHKQLLANDVLIVENITNAQELLGVPSFEINVIPLKIKAEGAFVRAFARIK
jgi:kynurenine formamidase